jgi:NAD(P)-dependent dehydrogenase (short-subunit alcohol dehydrogenase family)
MSERLAGKTAVITGGTSGIGLATAKLFHAEGARVLVTGANPATLDRARAVLGGVAEVVQSDAGDGAQLRALFADVERRWGGLDVLFLNAGRVPYGSIVELPEREFDDTFRLNVKGPWLALKAAIPLLRRGGAVVLNTSVNGILGMPNTSVYAASKAALRSLARTAAGELAARGVRVNAVSPGPTDSGILDKMAPTPEFASAHKVSLAAKIPLQRMGTVDEVARAALFLACDDSSFMTGEEIVVDGGLTRI